MELSNKYPSGHRTERISVTTEMFNVQLEAGQAHTQMHGNCNGNSYRQITLAYTSCRFRNYYFVTWYEISGPQQWVHS